MFKRLLATLFAAGLSTSAVVSHATTVQFQTSLGEIEVVLFDQATPVTVANFLDYVTSGAYQDTIVHRSIPNFVVQGGGFTLADEVTLKEIPKNDSVINEPYYSNVAGTIAMAKLGGQPDSATSQWFFNVRDNSSALDYQNDGFTVFGQVTGEGMAVVNAINAVKTYSSIPLQDYTDSDENMPTEDNFIWVYGVTIIDADPNSADQLDELPPKIQPRSNAQPQSKSGGALGLGALSTMLLALLFARMLFAGASRACVPSQDTDDFTR
ncbi:MAG TPA: peptidylprolyl isomerase [Marinagarivorans sp.]